MHWADVIAKDVAERIEHPLIATGISPTGIIHVGSLREAITGESVRSALAGIGSDVRLIYLIDSFDPLRRRYDFLPEEFEKYVGMPICRIPCPCGKHDNYAHHFIQPFLDAVDSLGVHCEIIWTHQLYEQGKFAECIDMTLKRLPLVISILAEVTGRDMPKDFSPYTPLCENCGRFTKTVNMDTYEFPYLEYDCPCGHHGKADLRKADGKLTWRLEWPAKWKIFGTSVEPFGKDHAAAGGSYDSGKRIVTEIFDGVAPYPVPYEFVQLKGVGQMHKSLGSPVTGLDAINMTPPEVLNYLFLRVNPQKTIDYDSGMGTLDMADEYDRMERLYFNNEFTEVEENSVRAYAIAQHNCIPKKQPLQIPYRHLVNVVQMTDNFEGIIEILKRTEDFTDVTDDDISRIERRVNSVRYWLNGFAPDAVKFSVSKTMPKTDLSSDEKTYFAALARRFETADWTPETINNIVAEEVKITPIGSKKGFQALYKILIDRTSGPRLGNFLATMDKEFVVSRLKEAAC